jgi:hypothetical protein
MRKYSTLKQKDYDYLTFILKQGIVTVKQMIAYFDEPNQQRVYRRLQKLSERGLVKNEKLALTLGVYYCTCEARDLLDMPVTVPTKVTLYTAQHDLLVNDLIIHQVKALKNAGVDVTYQSERELRYQFTKTAKTTKEKLKLLNQVKDTIPDVILYANGKAVAFELELNQKDKKRYHEKFRYFDKLIQEGKYSEVWYFVDTKKVENTLVSAREEVMINKDRLKVKPIPKAVKGEE